MILELVWPNQQCHSTKGQWLVNQVKGQSHQAQLKNFLLCMKIKDTEALRW